MRWLCTVGRAEARMTVHAMELQSQPGLMH
jgi:hypothetical protein